MNDFVWTIERLRAGVDSVDSAPGVDEGGPSQAAVAIVLRENLGSAEVLIIKRAERAGDHWSGNLAFPGGRWEPQDQTLLHTAIRETREEVGLDIEIGGSVIGTIESMTTNNPIIPRVQVAPFIAIAPGDYHIRKPAKAALRGLILSDEVATAFWVPLSFLVDNGRGERFSMTFNGEKREWPAYPTDHGLIWGMTENMITRFLSPLIPKESGKG